MFPMGSNSFLSCSLCAPLSLCLVVQWFRTCSRIRFQGGTLPFCPQCYHSSLTDPSGALVRSWLSGVLCFLSLSKLCRSTSSSPDVVTTFFPSLFHGWGLCSSPSLGTESQSILFHSWKDFFPSVMIKRQMSSFLYLFCDQELRMPVCGFTSLADVHFKSG